MQNTQYKIAVLTNVSGQVMQDLICTAKEYGVVFDQIKYSTIPLSDLHESEFISTICSYDIIYYRTGLKGAVINEISNIAQEKNIPTINVFSQHNYIHEKSRQALIASRNKINQPKSVMLGSGNYEDLTLILGNKFVAKPIVGSQGTGVSLITSADDLKKIKSLHLGKKFMYQEYLENSVEYRVYTLGNLGVASYKKIPGKEDFRANLHTGGSMTSTEPELSEKLLEFGGEIAKSFGVDIAGIDILMHEEKLYFLEINTQPGWENLDKVSGKSLSEQTLQFILDKAHNDC